MYVLGLALVYSLLGLAAGLSGTLFGAVSTNFWALLIMANVLLLAAGGVIYSVGAVFYAMRRPNPWPDVFGHHEFFHACTLVAALCHHIAIYFALYA